MSVHFSSQRLDWKTPKAVYQILDAEFRFDHDPCPPNYQIDGLASEWGKSNYVNPPYGRELPKFIAKGYEEWQKGKTVVFLIPSRTDTRWWHDYCMKASEIRFVRGRLKFDDQENAAPFPSAIVIFRATNKPTNHHMTTDYHQKNQLQQLNTDKELREKLAAIEHQRWADWQRYVHSLCYENTGIGGEPTGELTIPSEPARRWERQIETPYEKLSDREKASDMEQVDRYWQLITADRKRVAMESRIDELELVYPQLQKHYGVSGEGNYYYDDRIAELKAQQEEVK